MRTWWRVRKSSTKCGPKSLTQMISRTQKMCQFTRKETRNYPRISPISLDSSYKILTKILQTRISDATDQLISDTQFGSRRGKKYLRTAVLRETPTGYSRSWPPKHNCDLDWEKAFDRISHMRLVELPERMKTDSKMFSNIKALYEHPCFKTVHKNRESEWKKNILEFVKDAPCPPIFLFWWWTCCYSMLGARTMILMFERRTTTWKFFQELL